MAVSWYHVIECASEVADWMTVDWYPNFVKNASEVADDDHEQVHFCFSKVGTGGIEL